MNTLQVLAGCIFTWCALCATSMGQQSTATNPATAPNATPGTTSPNPAAANGGTANSSNDPTNAANTANPSSPASTGVPPAAGTTPLSGAQPGQTGSMESQRLNSLNQAYENQQRAMTQQQQQLNQQRLQGDINQLAPGGPLPGSAPIRAGINRPLGPTIDRNLIIGDLRQLGRPVDDWRVVNRQGRWWYWTPDNSWLFYDDGNWTAYQVDRNNRDQVAERRRVSLPPGYLAEDWRLVRHNGRWWFWTPQESWMYFRDGRWNDYHAARTQYGVGYRGSASGNGEQTANPELDTIQTQSEASSNAGSPNE